MSDAFWGFWGSVIGSLIGGAIAYFVALKAAAAQTRATWEIEHDKHQKELAWQLVHEIDEYVLCSFQSDGLAIRRRAARRLLTSAALCVPDRVPAIRDWVKGVDAYHYAKEQGRSLPRGVGFTPMQQFFDALQADIAQKHFDFAWEQPAHTRESKGV
ncbi:MAG: hypothetical protein Q4G71_13560 [Pseudomonadota bacterium]|nr:hypothetical protein [Pseudomonadota bacterium]